ncbi:glycosyltransferase family 39 protein [bacterium]|nr:glycosyltransferase family 39 protein [bacterium]
MKKNKTVIFAFWTLIAIALLYITNTLINSPYNFDVKALKPVLKPITINVESTAMLEETMFCFNKHCASPVGENIKRVYGYRFNPSQEGFYNEPVKTIYIANPADDVNLKETLKFIDLQVGSETHYYTNEDIQKFQDKSFEIELEGDEGTIKYNAIMLPEVDNYNGIFNHICSIFIYIMNNFEAFTIAWVWLFAAFLLFIFNREQFDFKFKIDHKYVLGLIILLGIILRLNGICSYPLWTDEVYTKIIALDSFKTTLQDPGNPPLFFLLEYLFTRIIGTSDFALRFLPFMYSLGIIPVIYLIFKDNSKKLALFMSALASFNVVMIFYAQEARSYSLSMFMCVLGIYLLFRYLKNPNTKNLIFYSLCTVCMVNTNYYLVIIAFCNFIWGIVDLLENKNKNHIKNFVIANILSSLTFIPYLLISFSKAIKPEFNSWIPVLSKENFESIIKAFFTNKIIALITFIIYLINLIVCFVPKIPKNKEKENMFIYLSFTITLFTIIACAISLHIKPFYCRRLLFHIYPYYLLLEGIIVASVFEIKNFSKQLKAIWAFVAVLVLGFYFVSMVPDTTRLKSNYETYLKFVQNDSKRYHEKGYDVYVGILDYKDYIKAYPKLKEFDYFKYFIIHSNTGVNTYSPEDIKKLGEGKKVVYFMSMGVAPDKDLRLKAKLFLSNSSLLIKVEDD